MAKFWDILDKYDEVGEWDAIIDLNNGNIESLVLVYDSTDPYQAFAMFQEAAPLVSSGSQIELDINGHIEKWIFDGTTIHRIGV